MARDDPTTHPLKLKRIKSLRLTSQIGPWSLVMLLGNRQQNKTGLSTVLWVFLLYNVS